MSTLKNQFNYLNLINKEKKNNIRVQIIVVTVALIKKQKNFENKRRKLKFSFDFDDINFVDIDSTFDIINESILQQINRTLNVQNVNIIQIIERMNNMKTIFIKFINIIQRIDVKLKKQNRVFRFRHNKQRDKSLKFVFFDFVDDLSMNFIKKKRFKTIDVDYFDFYLSNNYGKNDVITSNEKIIYRNVFFFIESIKFITKLMKYSTTKIRLHRCFRDVVMK